MDSKKKVIIVGGGFGGIRAALDLLRRASDLEIILVSDKSYFEYYPALYRVVAGYSAHETCIPLSLIFATKPVEIVEDRIVAVDLKSKFVTGKNGFASHFDYLVFALGSEVAYFDIPGLIEHSFGLKSTYEALQLRKHLEGVVAVSSVADLTSSPASLGHIVVVGAGPAGVELAGEIALYTRSLRRKYKLKTNPITIDLFEAAPRLLPQLDQALSRRARWRLHYLGVNIFVNRALVREEVDTIFLKDMAIKAKTVVWTAGTKPNRFFNQIDGLTFDHQGRVLVDQFLRPPGFPQVFVIGDGASSKYSGLAQTALHQASYVANLIMAPSDKTWRAYEPRRPAVAIPIGRGWALALVGKFAFSGRVGWWIRRLADLLFFFSILTPLQALRAFQYGATLVQSEPISISPEAK